MLHYNPRHVSSINMPIFRRTNCIITVWLQKRASKLRHAYIACLVITELENAYCAVRPESLHKTDTFRLEGLK